MPRRVARRSKKRNVEYKTAIQETMVVVWNYHSWICGGNSGRSTAFDASCGFAGRKCNAIYRNTVYSFFDILYFPYLPTTCATTPTVHGYGNSFHFAYRRLPLMLVSLVPTEMDTSVQEGVSSATTVPSIHHTVILRNPSLHNWKRENSFSVINIRIWNIWHIFKRTPTLMQI